MNYQKRGNKYIIYIGFIVSPQTALKYLNSFAGNEAEYNLIKNVLDEYNTYICSYSYNHYINRKSLFRKARKASIPGCDIIDYYGISLINIPIVKRINSFIQISKYLKRTVKKIKNENCNADIKIITCNSYPLFSIPALRVAKKNNIQTISYLIDGDRKSVV